MQFTAGQITMKMGRLIAAAVVLAALAATLYLVQSSQSQRKMPRKPPPAQRSKIVSLKQDDISKLEIKKKDGDDVVLTRVGADDWKITSPKSLLRGSRHGIRRSCTTCLR